MASRYFSEREAGDLPLTRIDVSHSAWRGLAVQVQNRLENGSFGKRFPEMCPDGPMPCGADWHKFFAALYAEVPSLNPPSTDPDSFSPPPDFLDRPDPPPIADLMDLIEFCWRSVGEVRRGEYHKFHNHYHITFDEAAGQSQFREDVNLIFRSNGIAFTLTAEGKIERVLPREFDHLRLQTDLRTGDTVLDQEIETARRKFLEPGPQMRYEALRELWDAWERLKTVDISPNRRGLKRQGIEALLAGAVDAQSQELLEFLRDEALALTEIGNKFHIRHSETSQVVLQDPEQLDYLFYRMLALVNLLLRARSRARRPPV